MEDNKYQCIECGKVCKNAIGLSGHSRSHLSAKVKSGGVLREKAEGPRVNRPLAARAEQYSFVKYMELPPPIVEHLKVSFGNWLNYLEVGQKWRSDFGGYALYIRVPEQYSTEWKRIDTPVYDNATKRIAETKKEIIPDERWCSLIDIPKAIKWIELVKQNIISKAVQSGMNLPSTGTGVDHARQQMATIQ